MESLAASLLTPSSSEPRTPAGKARVLDARKWLRERDGLSAGGRWIRTSCSARKSVVNPQHGSIGKRDPTRLSLAARLSCRTTLAAGFCVEALSDACLHELEWMTRANFAAAPAPACYRLFRWWTKPPLMRRLILGRRANLTPSGIAMPIETRFRAIFELELSGGFIKSILSWVGAPGNPKAGRRLRDRCDEGLPEESGPLTRQL